MINLSPKFGPPLRPRYWFTSPNIETLIAHPSTLHSRSQSPQSVAFLISTAGNPQAPSAFSVLKWGVSADGPEPATA
jgi:hypothetical protein